MCADNGKYYNYEKVEDESSSKARSMLLKEEQQ